MMTSSIKSTTNAVGNEECRVLLVEDHIESAQPLVLALQSQGHDVQTAHNGTEALVVATTYRPHIILIDIGLPGLDGLYVTKQLRASDVRMLIIAVTGQSGPEAVGRSRAAGCDHRLTKPVDFELLFRLLDDWKAESGCSM